MMPNSTDSSTSFALSCPIPLSDYPQVLLAHGGGGKLMHQLIDRMFLTAFGNQKLAQQHDGAVFETAAARLAFSTDSYVVNPLFFPGGDIGQLAVYGTVNDLAMCGARPLYLSVGFILEEGLSMETLWRVVQSMQAAAGEVGVNIVTGDTKVVDRGKGDGIFINTAGIGVIEHDQPISPDQVQPGDAVLLSGDVGRHGTAIMAIRENLSFETTIESDSAPLWDVVRSLIDAGLEIHCLRDLTRGGLSSGLIEVAQGAQLQINVEENAVPIRSEVANLCEVLGLDPFCVANEGRLIVFVPGKCVDQALHVLQAHPLGENAHVIAQVVEGTAGLVTLRTKIGTSRILDMLSGEQLPRIC